MSNKFRLEILASNRKFYDGACDSLTIPTFDGEMGILANHENMVVAVHSGVMHFNNEKGERIEAVVSGGLAEIIDNNVFMLVHTAELPEEIDVRRAEEALERAKEALHHKQNSFEYHRSRASLLRAMARMKAAGKK